MTPCPGESPEQHLHIRQEDGHSYLTHLAMATMSESSSHDLGAFGDREGDGQARLPPPPTDSGTALLDSSVVAKSWHTAASSRSARGTWWADLRQRITACSQAVPHSLPVVSSSVCVPFPLDAAGGFSICLSLRPFVMLFMTVFVSHCSFSSFTHCMYNSFCSSVCPLYSHKQPLQPGCPFCIRSRYALYIHSSA